MFASELRKEVWGMCSHIAEGKIMAVGWVTGSALALVNLLADAPWTRWIAPGWFGFTLLLLMTIEMLTCYFGASPAGRRTWPWEKHITSKMLLVALALVSLILDSLILVAVRYLPMFRAGEDAFPDWATGFLPITLSTLIWLNTAEAVRAVKNIAKTTGDDSIPPIILWVIRQLRKVDQARLPPGAKQDKRLMDNVTEEDIRTILKRLELQDALDPPPQPLGPADPEDVPPVKET
jgi:hypothetical protein